MRRIGFVIVIALCSGFLPSMLSGTAQGQEGCTITSEEFVLWDCVEPPDPIEYAFMPEGDLTTIGERKFQGYQVEFRDQFAAVPRMDQFLPEFMIVTVVLGDFVLENEDERERAFIVDPGDGNPIPVVERIAFAPDPGPYFSEPTGNLPLPDTANECVDMCPVPPGTAVQVKAGDTVYALEGALCIWCLVNSLPENQGSTSGVLQVAALVDPTIDPNDFAAGFSWIRDFNERAGTLSSAGSESSSTMMTWAMFGPRSGCHGG